MRKMWRQLFVISALASLLCLTGLILSGSAYAQQCVDNGDGTVTDNTAGQMWQQATAGRMSHPNARDYARNLVLAGHSDWDLPYSEHLQQLFQSPCRALMTIQNDWYWSLSIYMYGGVSGFYRVHQNGSSQLEYTLSNMYSVVAVRRIR